MSLWLPPGVTEAMLDERQRLLADYVQQAETLSAVRHFNRELKRIDERLELVKAKDNAYLPGLRAGFWHVIRRNPGAPPGIICHEGPNGEYLEPDSGLFRRLEESDFWDDRVRKARERRQKALKRAAEREDAREREARVEEVMDRFNARHRPSIRVPRGV